jgi:hypothetical protein
MSAATDSAKPLMTVAGRHATAKPEKSDLRHRFGSSAKIGPKK